MANVLIIDDDEELCMELKEILEDEGYKAWVALDGRAGKELMEHNAYAVVILDLKLPELNGYEVLKTAKQAASGPKIIVLSGRPLGDTPLNEPRDRHAEEDKILTLADAVMNKPVPIPLLLDKIKSYTC
ncbi:MAG: response regulator [Candidatus Omnitrophica bacterium]|nr:response regulator [Candidatus Omnitrophota bacterium]